MVHLIAPYALSSLSTELLPERRWSILKNNALPKFVPVMNQLAKLRFIDYYAAHETTRFAMVRAAPE
jgi:hypothetical protein